MLELDLPTQRVKSQDPVSHLVLEVTIRRLSTARRGRVQPSRRTEDDILDNTDGSQRETRPSRRAPTTDVLCDAAGKLQRVHEACPIKDEICVTQQFTWQAKVLSRLEVCAAHTHTHGHYGQVPPNV